MENRIHAAVVQACRNFMVPIARFLLRNGFSYREFIEVAKWAFVHVASEDYGIRGRKTNISRVALLTGISRKEVSALVRKLELPEYLLESSWRIPSQVLAEWHSNPKYVNDSGTPIALPLHGQLSLDSLVANLGKDVPLGAVIKELVVTGAIAEDDNQLYYPKLRHHIIDAADAPAIAYSGLAISNLVSTINNNINPSENRRPFFQRSAYAVNIPGHFRARIQDLLEVKGQALLAEIDGVIGAGITDNDPGKARCASGVSLFYFENDTVF